MKSFPVLYKSSYALSLSELTYKHTHSEPSIIQLQLFRIRHEEWKWKVCKKNLSAVFYPSSSFSKGIKILDSNDIFKSGRKGCSRESKISKLMLIIHGKFSSRFISRTEEKKGKKKNVFVFLETPHISLSYPPNLRFDFSYLPLDACKSKKSWNNNTIFHSSESH